MKSASSDASAAVVMGGSAFAREAVTAVLRAAGIPLGEPGPDCVTVLIDPEAEDWEMVSDVEAKVVLVTTGVLDADTILAAVLKGADAVVEADAPSERLAHAITVVAGGGTELSPMLVRRVADALRVHALEEEPSLSVTPRERDILTSIDAGETVKQTARTLGIAPKTVENLQSRLFRKLGVRNRAQAVALAHSLGLVPTTDDDDE